MNGLTDEEQRTIAFYDNNATSWSDSHLDSGYWKAQLDEFKKLLPAGKLLEIGCGGGRDARDIISLGYDYTGTDISEGLLTEARKNVPGHEFIKQSVYDLDFKEKFDGFWACAVLLHVPKGRIGEALRSIKSVLKPDAVGFISIKKGNGEKLIRNGNVERFFAFWGKTEFTEVLEANAFKVVTYIYDPRSVTDHWHCFFVRNK